MRVGTNHITLLYFGVLFISLAHPIVILKDSQMADKVGLSKSLKESLLKEDLPLLPSGGTALNQALTLDSVYAYANSKNLPLLNLLDLEPVETLMYAEACVAKWEQVLCEASLTGTLVHNSKKYYVDKNQILLLKTRVDNARADLAMLQKNSGVVPIDGGLRKETLMNALYKKAVAGDLNAMKYLYDRVEGKVANEQDVDTEYSTKPLIYDIIMHFHAKQLEVLNSGSGTKICECSRRSGKSRLMAAWALMTCLSKPRTNALIIGQTQELEEGIVDAELQMMIDDLQLKDSKGKRLNWRRLENNSKLMVRGLSNTRQPDVIRGFGRAKFVGIDEFFHLDDTDLEYLQENVITPMQQDFGMEFIQLLCGTPASRRGTWGDKVWDTWKIPHFHWTSFDNPYEPDPDAFIDRICLERGITRDHPTIRREYLGEHGIYETEWMLYPRWETYNLEKDGVYPQINVDSIYCGIDYGTRACSALVAVAWDTVARRGFVWFESKFTMNECGPGEAQFERLQEMVRQCWSQAFTFFPKMPKKEANNCMVWSADYSDKMLTQLLAYKVNLQGETLHINIQDAMKGKGSKNLMRDKIRGLLATGSLLLPEDGLTETECKLTMLKKDKLGNVTDQLDDKLFHPDILPALRYALWEPMQKELINGK